MTGERADCDGCLEFVKSGDTANLQIISAIMKGLAKKCVFIALISVKILTLRLHNLTNGEGRLYICGIKEKSPF